MAATARLTFCCRGFSLFFRLFGWATHRASRVCMFVLSCSIYKFIVLINMNEKLLMKNTMSGCERAENFSLRFT
jgi:hypothetical protein